MEVKRIFDLLPYHQQTFRSKDDMLAGKDNGQWVKYRIEDYIEMANNVSYAFMAMGLKKGDKIASISTNRPEWNFIDMGAQQIGVIHIPIYPTISAEDYKYILNHAEVKYLFVTGQDLFRKIQPIISQVPSIIDVYTYKNLQGHKHLNELIDFGKDNADEEKLEEIKASISEDDLLTIIYTSGTTGIPKGVMLSHKNIISDFKSIAYIPQFGQEEKALSFLPLCHIYERMMNYLYHYLGFSIYYLENMAYIMDTVVEVKPAMMTAVPRLIEKIYDKIMLKGMKLKGIQRKIFFWSIKIGLSYELYGANGWWYGVKLFIADMLVFSKWRQALGGRLGILVSGGAALQPRLARIFWAAGLHVYEGYGLTETSPVIAVTNGRNNGVKFGTVGIPIEHVSLKIAENGEILCKGPNLMLGYYKDPALTKEVIDEEGWFHTGDVGVIEPEGQLKITGRIKEIFKTSFGKYISPELIENKFKESEYIDTITVLGENQKFAAAIIVPDFENLKLWCKKNGVDYSTNHKIIGQAEILKLYQEEVNKYNKFFGAAEQIRKFELMDYEWTVETGELTTTLKLRRSFINRKHKELIERMFNIGDDFISDPG